MYAKALLGVALGFTGGALIYVFDLPLVGALTLLASSAAFVWSTTASPRSELTATLLICLVVSAITLSSSMTDRFLIGGYALITGVAVWVTHSIVRPWLLKKQNRSLS